MPLGEEAKGESSSAKPAVAPTHAVFFATACWHLQAPDQWPAFQPSSRQVLHDEEGLFTARGEPVYDYLAFREAFRSLASALMLTTWQLEHLSWWHAQRTPVLEDDASGYSALVRVDAISRRPTSRREPPDDRRLTSPVATRGPARLVVREPMPPYVPFSEPPALDHTHVQWLLAKVGKQLGCRVWIAANDWRREWGDDYVVAPASRLPKVRRELLRPTFRALGPWSRCDREARRSGHE